MNLNFAKLDGQKITYAPDSGKVGSIFFSKLSESQYRLLGYKPVVNEKPEPTEGYVVRFVKYTEDENNIYFSYDQIEKHVEHEQKSMPVSKIFLKIALIKIGLWDMFNEWMESTNIDLGDGKSINVKDAWDVSLVLDVKSELFGPYIDAAREHFADYITTEQLDQIFEECRAK